MLVKHWIKVINHLKMPFHVLNVYDLVYFQLLDTLMKIIGIMITF